MTLALLFKKYIKIGGLLISACALLYWLSLHVSPNGTKFNQNDQFVKRSLPYKGGSSDFCGNYEIVRVSDNFRITTGTLCEENVKTINFINNEIIVISDRNRTLYRKNVVWRWVY
jgi:hypothetical protein